MTLVLTDNFGNYQGWRSVLINALVSGKRSLFTGWPETLLGEISSDVPEADFWPTEHSQTLARKGTCESLGTHGLSVCFDHLQS
jgi:hypothetical protein